MMSSENAKSSPHSSASVVGDIRSDIWKKRKSSITFSKLASSLNPEVLNEPRLSRVSTIKSSASSSHDPEHDYCQDYVVGTCSSSAVDCAFGSVSSQSVGGGFRFRERFRLPKFFDGVNEDIWWKLTFENEELEKLYQDSQEVAVRTLYRMACGFLTLASLTHAVYFGLHDNNKHYVTGPSCFAFVTLAFLVATYITTLHGVWEKRLVHLLALTLVVAALSTLAYPLAALSPLGRFGIGAVVLTVLYVFLPLHLPLAALLGLMFSLAFELLQEFLLGRGSGKVAVMKIFLHLTFHFVLLCISLLSEVYRRNTFWRIGRSLLYQDQLDFELALKEKMIHSMMPEIIASELLEIDNTAYQSIFKRDTTRFRPLMLHRMDNVTILFADIVGFTKMSSSKTAETLVSLLNNLFNRFDRLASALGCEKISTLGDCYYCVAGCPVSCEDHADRCVQMGLSMLQAIKEFCQETGEDINMRVGIHTGTVLCGIVGVHRFKFDVFSNDVQLANQVESGGIAGMVHISQATYDALTDPHSFSFRKSDGAARNEQLRGITTYLVSVLHRPSRVQRSSSEPLLEMEERDYSKRTSSFRGKLKSSAREEDKRKWIDTKASQSLPMKESQKIVNSKTLFRMPSTDEASSPKVLLDLPDEPDTIADLLKAREEAPRVKVRPSELAVSDLLRIAVAPLASRTPQEEERSARLQEQQLVIQILRQSWGKLLELKKISSMEWSPITLVFNDKDLEVLHRSQFNTPSGQTSPLYFDSPIFSYFLQVVITIFTFIVFLVVFSVMFTPTLSIIWLVFFSLLLVFNLLVVFSVGSVCYVLLPKVADFLRPVVCNWWVAHTAVIIMLSAPVALVGGNWPCSLLEMRDKEAVYFNFFILQVSLTTCLLFTQLHRIIKLAVSICICGLMIIMVRVPCTSWGCPGRHATLSAANKSAICSTVVTTAVHNEAFLVFSVYLVLIVILSRQYEAASRLNFKSQLLAQVSFAEIQQLKEQADSLLSNLLPDHVCQQVRVTSSYSENHEMAGVLFATIANFSDFYSETYEGGIGCIRVLNELISDFDDLLCKPEFASVEKIKTIGATYMAASGLNSMPLFSPFQRIDQTEHLRGLLEFAFQMQDTVRAFNENMVGYEFVLRIGFNCGPVTAGVVGSTKLLYDIWGDTVNVASRMDSTGLADRIQVPSPCFEMLEDFVLATPRDEPVLVKGKGEMMTYFIDSVIRVQRHSVMESYGFNSPALFISTMTSSPDCCRRGEQLHEDSSSQSINFETGMRPSRSAPSRASMINPHDEKGACHQRHSSSSAMGSMIVSGHSLRQPSSSGRRSLGCTNLFDTGQIPLGGARPALQKTFSLPSNAGQRIAKKLSQANPGS